MIHLGRLVEAAMPDPILIATGASLLGVAIAFWRAWHHGCKLTRASEDRDG